MQATNGRHRRSKQPLMRPVKPLVAVGLTALVFLPIIGACTASADEVRPPDDQIFFPTGAAVAPDESALFVANANSELRYDSGSISVFDLPNIDAVVAGWLADRTVPDGCEPDRDRTETLVCDEASFISAQAGVRVGNFATDIAIQDLGTGLRLMVPTRGSFDRVGRLEWLAAVVQPGERRLRAVR